MSRPEIPIDWEKVDELLACGCPGTEVAAVLGMHHETFYHRVEKKFNIGFTEYSAKKKATGEALLRKAQYEKALGISKKGDNTLLIWLGKQRLNQKETASEPEVNAQITKQYLDVMNQISSLQSARNIEDKSLINDAKSA